VCRIVTQARATCYVTASDTEIFTGSLYVSLSNHQPWSRPTEIRVVFSHRTLLPTPRDFPAMTSIQNSMNTRTFAAR
jgi:hypothetical protein